MEKEFVEYAEALELKALGFDEPCFAVYYNTKEFKTYTGAWVKFNSKFDGRGVISAPLYQQAFRWFREKYGLQHKPWSGKISTVFYGYDILNIEEQEFVINNSENGGGDCDYDTYEEAELECLKKLIELVNK
jgi:hypothetical protein